MKSKMINNLIGLGTILLGATMAKKAGVKFFESSTYLDFEPTDNLINSIKRSEGLVETAYRLPNESQYTIGFGTSFLFDGNGNAFPKAGSNGVKAGQSLSSLKVLMGYRDLANYDFAKQLVENHLKASRYTKVARDLDSFGVPFRIGFAEALMEVSYGSGSIFGSLKSDIYYTNFLINVRNDPSDKSMAFSYLWYRYNYYKNCTASGQWSLYAYGWMRRVVKVTYFILGKNISDSELVNMVGSSSRDKTKLANFVLTNFGIKVVW
ncbi:hypothetical protein [Elizabethkingia bruuniana]|uniref:hypothetical protein n=1 Tax=Elizabethkingia bruuniana TaxID=1756149 RepID=UPI001055EF33|nr:hypothetical protein [Elizabethkingia bruuniana]